MLLLDPSVVFLSLQDNELEKNLHGVFLQVGWSTDPKRDVLLLQRWRRWATVMEVTEVWAVRCGGLAVTTGPRPMSHYNRLHENGLYVSVAHGLCRTGAPSVLFTLRPQLLTIVGTPYVFVQLLH